MDYKPKVDFKDDFLFSFFFFNIKLICPKLTCNKIVDLKHNIIQLVSSVQGFYSRFENKASRC